MRIQTILSIFFCGITMVGCSSQSVPPAVDTSVAEQAAAKAQQAANQAAAANRAASNANSATAADVAKTETGKK